MSVPNPDKKISFYKYHGTGNDFLMFEGGDLLKLEEEDRVQLFKKWCHRRFGVGADGVIMVIPEKGEIDFRMRYFNADGRAASFCGNGSRCAAHFARFLGLVNHNPCRFIFNEDLYTALIEEGGVAIKMKDVKDYAFDENGLVVDTGSPHVVIRKNFETADEELLFVEAKTLRSDPKYGEGGANVNYLYTNPKGESRLHTFERGVENFTYSCGTGAVAAAISEAVELNAEGDFQFSTKGGKIGVRIGGKKGRGFVDIWLSGPAERVFKGEITY